MMPSIIDPETMHIDDLPGVWNPIQWEITEQERILEVENQAKASLLSGVDVPEAILRLLLEETDIERAYAPPQGFDPEMQGDWDEELITFVFKRRFRLDSVDRKPEELTVVYHIEGLGYWSVEVEHERVTIERI
jgi:hypothetical protein